jgi:hypothetical protein
MITGMIVFGARVSLGRNVALSAALLVGAASAAAAASPSDLQQASALCNSAAPSWLVPEQGSWGINNGLSISGFGATAQPIPFLVETAQWLSTGGNGTAIGPCNFWPYDTVQLNNSSFAPLTDPTVLHSGFFWPTLTRGTTPTLTRVLFDPTPMTSNTLGFSKGPLPQIPAGSFTIFDDSPPPPATVGSGARP